MGDLWRIFEAVHFLAEDDLISHHQAGAQRAAHIVPPGLLVGGANNRQRHHFLVGDALPEALFHLIVGELSHTPRARLFLITSRPLDVSKHDVVAAVHLHHNAAVEVDCRFHDVGHHHLGAALQLGLHFRGVHSGQFQRLVVLLQVVAHGLLVLAVLIQHLSLHVAQVCIVQINHKVVRLKNIGEIH